MIRETPADFLIITDSDVCVTPNCLREVVAPLLDSKNGLVTCLYKGVAAGGFWSQLEALGMSVELPSGVLVGNMLEGMTFALGPIMATRRDVIEAIGGISALADYHADDYKLGNLTHSLGKQVILSNYICGHVAMNTSARMSIAHQTRWMRSTRFSRKAGHVGTGLTYALPFGVLGFLAGLASHDWRFGVGLLGWAFLNRIVQSILVGRLIIGDRESLKLCWLYPLRDFIGFFIWCGSFLGNEMLWRNERYRFVTDGKIVRL
jgi:ceramide glucosyltransferase